MRPGSWARAFTGHVTLAPARAMNSRRLVVFPLGRRIVTFRAVTSDRLPVFSMSPLMPRQRRYRCVLQVTFRANDIRSSLDHLIGGVQELVRDAEAERVGGLEVDRELERRWLLDRQLGWIGAV